ncbi:hypothetical protein FQA39_LY17352 [Lamprigera yunnana]|nr:hypothetical protein FQA39_LY17352 [Lamprigera yunnana]
MEEDNDISTDYLNDTSSEWDGENGLSVVEEDTIMETTNDNSILAEAIIDWFEVESLHRDVFESKEIEIENKGVASHCTDNSAIGRLLDFVTISDMTTFTTNDTAPERAARPSNLAISSSSPQKVESISQTSDVKISSILRKDVTMYSI